MRNLLLWLGVALLASTGLSACSSQSDKDCVRLTPSSRRCARPGFAADPPPPASLPTVSAAPASTVSVAPSPSAAWSITTPEHPLAGLPTLRETVWTSARPPFDTYDFVALRCIAMGEQGQRLPERPVVVLFPGAHQHGEIIEPREQADWRLYLAARGIETWTVDYRTHYVTREQILDSRFMQAWTTEAFVDDAVAAIRQVREVSGQAKVFVGGFGLGATFAALAAARTGGEGIAGIVLLDGYVLDPLDADAFYRQRPPTPNWFADDLEGHYLPYKRWIKILQDVIDDPNGPDFFPEPMFDNRAQALAHFLYVSSAFGGRGGLSNAKNGRADVVALARMFQRQDRYWPRAQNHGGFELKRHLAGARFDYETAFKTLQLPLLAFSSDTMDNAGMAWSERVHFTAQATSTSDVEFRVLHDWGHLDILFGSEAAQEVFAPMAEWIGRHAGGERRQEGASAPGQKRLPIRKMEK
ncbi:MAG: alpha/beta hydrolase [Deltaproteobacteria bacterium]|nr:alpha/beta hydrolase [Deltaproteobacteria bacterium]